MSMAVGGGKGNAIADINVTPMVDIMLVLLIIFMVVTPLLQKGVSVDLAKTKNPREMREADRDDAVVVAVTRDAKIWLNADQIMVFVDHYGPGFFASRYNIGFWMWELADFPAEWSDRFEWFDEIWTPSAFTSEAIARRSPVPVWTSPLPLLAHPAAALGRADFGLPDDRFVFLFVFDFASVFERKNPLALVNAFRRGFRRDDPVVLVLKGAHAEADRRNADRLRDVSDRDSVLFLDRYLSRPEIAALMRAADAYVSLHRAEGYGLTMAEAMRIGKPVIATGYSGNLQFMNARNSLLVPQASANAVSRIRAG